MFHDDVIKWKHFPRYWPFMREIHRSPVNSPHKGQWRGALIYSLICVWMNGWVNNREAGDLRRYRAHDDVTVMYNPHHNQPASLCHVCRISRTHRGLNEMAPILQKAFWFFFSSYFGSEFTEVGFYGSKWYKTSVWSVDIIGVHIPLRFSILSPRHFADDSFKGIVFNKTRQIWGIW